MIESHPDYPWPEANDAVIWQGDCRELLERLPAWCVIVTDPPYGINYENRRGDIRPNLIADKIVGDADMASGQSVVTSCIRRGFPVCAFAHHRNPWAGEWRQFPVWDKGNAVGGGGDRETCWKFTWELIQISKQFGNLNGIRDGAVLRFPVTQASFGHHPTQKPVRLLSYLIEKLTSPGDLIVDPFAGSGSTLVACLKAGRPCIGIEIDPTYAAIARRRIAEARPTLFASLSPD